ncbi:MAG TPA: YqhA family protein [Candidatus Limnocylindrales bacterium]
MLRILGTSRFLILLAVLGTFVASATLQIFGLVRVVVVIADLIQARDVSAAASKSLIANTVAIIDLFLIGTVLYVISAGLYQLFVHHDVPLPAWLKIESLDDLTDNLTEVIVVALLVAFLGEAIEWTGDVSIVAFGFAIAAIIAAVALLVWVGRRTAPSRPTPVEAERSEHPF